MKSPADALSFGPLPPTDEHLLAVLARARDLGFLGPGLVEDHLRHAAAYLEALPPHSARCVDLGTGAGLPGLALAAWRPDLPWVLVDAMEKRIAFVRGAVAALGLHNVEAVQGRAEALGADPGYRGKVDLVVSRSLAAPAVAAEYAAPLLRVGGRAIVAEPPGGDPQRWPADGLKALGLAVDGVIRQTHATLQCLRQTSECPPRYPRRVGVAARKPLF